MFLFPFRLLYHSLPLLFFFDSFFSSFRGLFLHSLPFLLPCFFLLTFPCSPISPSLLPSFLLPPSLPPSFLPSLPSFLPSFLPTFNILSLFFLPPLPPFHIFLLVPLPISFYFFHFSTLHHPPSFLMALDLALASSHLHFFSMIEEIPIHNNQTLREYLGELEWSMQVLLLVFVLLVFLILLTHHQI